MANFTFLYPLWLIALLPLALLVPWLSRGKSKQGLIAPHLAERLGISQSKQVNKLPWLGTFWAIAVIAMAGPSWQTNTLPAYSISGARVLVMDMSRSMYATDITPNRLTQARFKALDMLPGWKEGTTGLVTYAADGYTISPLTQDSSTLSNLIPHLSPETMPIQGSNAAAGIEEAINLLKQAGHQQGDIILISDGLSDRESNAVNALLAGSQYRLSILAVGTTQGAPVKLPDGRLLTNSQGKTVVAKVDLDTLLPLTRTTGGQLELSQANNADVDRIVALTATPREAANESKEKELNERLNNGFWLLIPLIVIALFGFRRGIVLAVLITVMPFDPAYAASWQTPFKNSDTRGFELYEQGNFAEAAEQFESPAWKGAAQYKAGEFEQSIETLSPLDDPNSRYNLANAYAQTQQFDQAIDLYQSILEQDPANGDAKRNLELVKQLKDQQEQQSNQDQESGDQSQEDQQTGDSSDQNQQRQDQQSPSDGQQENSSQSDSQQQNQEGKDSEQSDAEQQNSEQQGSEQQDANQQGASQESSQQSGSEQQNADQQGAEQSDSQQQASAQQNSAQEQENQENNAAQSDGDEQDSSQTDANSLASEQQADRDGDEEAQAVQAAGEDGSSGISASDPVLKKLEQIPDDTAALIRAQMILQARQKQAPEATENSW